MKITCIGEKRFLFQNFEKSGQSYKPKPWTQKKTESLKDAAEAMTVEEKVGKAKTTVMDFLSKNKLLSQQEMKDIMSKSDADALKLLTDKLKKFCELKASGILLNFPLNAEGQLAWSMLLNNMKPKEWTADVFSGIDFIDLERTASLLQDRAKMIEGLSIINRMQTKKITTEAQFSFAHPLVMYNFMSLCKAKSSYEGLQYLLTYERFCNNVARYKKTGILTAKDVDDLMKRSRTGTVEFHALLAGLQRELEEKVDAAEAKK